MNRPDNVLNDLLERDVDVETDRFIISGVLMGHDAHWLVLYRKGDDYLLLNRDRVLTLKPSDPAQRRLPAVGV